MHLPYSQLPTADRHLAAFIASDAVVIGDVHLADRVNIWYKAVIRADVNRMDIGYCTNIQDGAILHGDPDQPLVIGEYVTIGHRGDRAWRRNWARLFDRYGSDYFRRGKNWRG